MPDNPAGDNGASAPPAPPADQPSPEAAPLSEAAEPRTNASPFTAALLAEYAALKNEQAQRLVVRDTCLFISITANIAIAAAYTQQQIHDNQILLFIPFASTLFFWVYATNDDKITNIRRYIVDQLLPNIPVADESSKKIIFGWEYLRRGWSVNRLFSKITRLLAVWLTFSGASLIALAATLPEPSDYSHSIPWLFAVLFTALPYVFGLWLIDL
jgi:hypothetical protein